MEKVVFFHQKKKKEPIEEGKRTKLEMGCGYFLSMCRYFRSVCRYFLSVCRYFVSVCSI